MAEEVDSVYPELVEHDRSGRIESVRYYELDAILLNEVQQLVAALKSSQAQIEQLKNQVAELAGTRQQVERVTTPATPTNKPIVSASSSENQQ